MRQRAGSEASANVNQWRQQLAERKWWHSFELSDGRHIKGVNDIQSLRRRIGLFPIPENLSGQRVLDIGTWDGWFAFEMERRGAEVVAVDCVKSENFLYLHRELNSRIDYRILDVYELCPQKLGQFDIVLFLGVLYHLKHPLLGLERVCALTRGLAAIQTFVSPDEGPPAMEFYETTELGGQFDNWVAPNPACVLAMCRTAGFARADLLEVNSFSAASVICYRRFEPDNGDPVDPAPCVRACTHMVSHGLNFSSARDEYASVWFSSGKYDLDRNNVQVRVGEFDAQPVFVGQTEWGWQANFKLPPGLTAGWNAVKIRAGLSPWSNATRIAVDLPLTPERLIIEAVCDGRTWKQFNVDATDDPLMTLWVGGMPENAGTAEIIVEVGEFSITPAFVAAWEDSTPSQVNLGLPKEMKRGVYSVAVRIGSEVSESVAFNYE